MLSVALGYVQYFTKFRGTKHYIIAPGSQEKLINRTYFEISFYPERFIKELDQVPTMYSRR